MYFVCFGILLYYVLTVVFSMIMFDMMNVERKKELIPVYNIYILLREYKGRVYKKNWGVIYVWLVILPLFVFIVLEIDFFREMGVVMILVLLGFMLSPIIVLGLLILNILVTILTYLPVFEKTWQRVVFIVLSIYSGGSPVLFLYIFPWSIISSSIIVSIILLIINIIVPLSCIVLAFRMRDKVKSGEYFVNSKIDVDAFRKEQVRAMLDQRRQCIALPMPVVETINDENIK